jgi:hypothetical protein
MDLNNENLRTILSNIYNIPIDFICLKQGNWYNPQALEVKPMTWIGYKILRNQPISLPDYQEEEQEDDEYKNFNEVTKIAELDLQFIGQESEALANGVSFWIRRQDVKDQLETVNGLLMAKDMTAWSSDYYLPGDNTITAWNVKIFICWVQRVTTNQELFESVVIEGGING